MTCLELLQVNGPMPADLIARTVNMRREDVYAELVAAEAEGLAEVRVTDCDDPSRGRVWAVTWRMMEGQ